MDNGQCCIMVTGAPGAGKSTVAGLPADSLSRSAVLNGDALNGMIVTGRVWAFGEPADEAARQVRLCNTNLCDLAAYFADSRFTPVMDWIIPDAEQLQFFLGGATPPAGAARGALPGARRVVCETMTVVAESSSLFEGHDALTATMQQGFGARGWWFDTSALSVKQTVVEILEYAQARANEQHESIARLCRVDTGSATPDGRSAGSARQ